MQSATANVYTFVQVPSWGVTCNCLQCSIRHCGRPPHSQAVLLLTPADAGSAVHVPLHRLPLLAVCYIFILTWKEWKVIYNCARTYSTWEEFSLLLPVHNSGSVHATLLLANHMPLLAGLRLSWCRHGSPPQAHLIPFPQAAANWLVCTPTMPLRLWIKTMPLLQYNYAVLLSLLRHIHEEYVCLLLSLFGILVANPLPLACSILVSICSPV